MSTHTIRQETGRVDRVKGGVTPNVALDLGHDEYLVSFDLRCTTLFGSAAERKTDDWVWTAFIARTSQ